jgi:hypothetical protein
MIFQSLHKVLSITLINRSYSNGAGHMACFDWVVPVRPDLCLRLLDSM